MITNIKFSLECTFDKRWRHIIKKNSENAGFNFKSCGNMYLIKKYKDISVCIIRKKLQEFHKEKEIVHVNVTGVKEIRQISAKIIFLYYNIFPSLCQIKSFKVDSLSYNFKYKKAIDFQKLKNAPCISHNFEKFPAIFYRMGNGTSLIFRNGNILIVGCKNMKDLLECKLKVVNLLQTFKVQEGN